jgi:hypothetical protein
MLKQVTALILFVIGGFLLAGMGIPIIQAVIAAACFYLSGALIWEEYR